MYITTRASPHSYTRILHVDNLAVSVGMSLRGRKWYVFRSLFEEAAFGTGDSTISYRAVSLSGFSLFV